jgi:hypothetical protein
VNVPTREALNYFNVHPGPLHVHFELASHVTVQVPAGQTTLQWLRSAHETVESPALASSVQAAFPSQRALHPPSGQTNWQVAPNTHSKLLPCLAVTRHGPVEPQSTLQASPHDTSHFLASSQPTDAPAPTVVIVHMASSEQSVAQPGPTVHEQIEPPMQTSVPSW